MYSLQSKYVFFGQIMRAINKANIIIERDASNTTAQIFAALIISLQNESDFSLKDLYSLESKDFDLAMDILDEWRLDRYYLGKTKTFGALTPTTQQSHPNH